MVGQGSEGGLRLGQFFINGGFNENVFNAKGSCVGLFGDVHGGVRKLIQ